MVNQVVSEDLVLQTLKTVKDPDLHRDIVSLGFIKDLKVHNGSVNFTIELTTPACPVKDQLKQECESKVRALPGVKEVRVEMTSSTRGRSRSESAAILPGVRNIIAVASGKGGVGKMMLSKVNRRKLGA